ncbi:MAG: alpha-L-fucosidase, partial [Clostridia bacterium]|nr:alpha-L-fucosidase [Clostridia bacterium]
MNSIPIPSPRIAAFENFGFGLFIHYGIYSLLEKGEKPMHFYQISNEEYRKLMPKFTADAFSGRELARLAKRAGMRYACLTARHHDGFSLFDTKGLNDYDAPHSAAGRDLIADFVEGCRSEGIVPFLYHTTLDWYDSRFKDDFPAYLAYLNASVELLCKNYGPIGGFWFDGNWSRKDVDWK